MTETLSPQQARKLVLLSQRILPVKQKGSALNATLSAIEHLGYIQIDTISVVQRAHHHTLWNRNPRYVPIHLDELVRDKQVFEYWSHAASYLPMRDYRFTLPRKSAMASGSQTHWYARNTPLINEVLARIRAEGPLMAKDFEHTGKKMGHWERKPAKRALENLFQEGKLMSAYRKNFHKVYDLTERVLPPGIDTSQPTQHEYAKFIITRYLRANGLGLASEIGYLNRGMKQLISSVLEEMVSTGELMHLSVAEQNYFAFTSSLELLDQPLARNSVKILSPFDNLIIQRKRTSTLFDFDYILECYHPAAKRRYGYFVLPILWEGKLVARMDCKADRKSGVLHIHHLALEPALKRIDAFASALAKELDAFMAFNQSQNIQIHSTSPANFSSDLNRKFS